MPDEYGREYDEEDKKPLREALKKRNPDYSALAQPGGGISVWGQPYGQAAGPVGSKILSNIEEKEQPPGQDVPAPAASGPVQMHPEEKSDAQGSSAQQQPQMITTPERWIDTLRPDLRQQMLAGQEAEQAGVYGGAQAESQAAERMQGKYEEGLTSYKALGEDQQSQMARERAGIQQHMQEQQDLANKLATHKVNPEHYMQTKTGAQKVGLAIAMALGSFGGSITHSQNAAGEIIKQRIEDDIQAQRQNIENSKEGLKAKTGILADKWRLLGNKEQAMAAARQDMILRTNMAIENEARQYQSPTILANAQKLQGQLMQHYAAQTAAFQKYVPQQTTQVGGPAISTFNHNEILRLADGRHVAIAEKDREPIFKSLAMRDTVRENVGQMRKLTSVPITQRGIQWVAAYDAARENLAKSELDAQGRGGLGIIEKNEEASGSRHGIIFTPGVEGALKQIEESANYGADAKIRNSALFEVNPVVDAQHPIKGGVMHAQVLGPYRDLSRKKEAARAGSAKAPGEP